MPELVTERLVIRRFETDDLEGCQAVLGAVGDPVSLDERREWLRWTVANYVQLEALHQPPYGDRAIAPRRGSRSSARTSTRTTPSVRTLPAPCP